MPAPRRSTRHNKSSSPPPLSNTGSDKGNGSDDDGNHRPLSDEEAPATTTKTRKKDKHIADRLARAGLIAEEEQRTRQIDAERARRDGTPASKKTKTTAVARPTRSRKRNAPNDDDAKDSEADSPAARPTKKAKAISSKLGTPIVPPGDKESMQQKAAKASRATKTPKSKQDDLRQLVAQHRAEQESPTKGKEHAGLRTDWRRRIGDGQTATSSRSTPALSETSNGRSVSTNRSHQRTASASTTTSAKKSSAKAPDANAPAASLADEVDSDKDDAIDKASHSDSDSDSDSQPASNEVLSVAAPSPHKKAPRASVGTTIIESSHQSPAKTRSTKNITPLCKDLPADWKKRAVPSFISYAGVSPAPWDIRGHVTDILKHAQKIYDYHFGEKYPDTLTYHHEFYHNRLGLMAAVHNWRSAIGQAGITAVDAWFAGDPIKGKPHSGLTTSAARGAWATEMVETTNYIYEHGDGDRKTRRFTSPLVLQVFAYHIGKTVEISKHEDEFLLPMEDYPVGALAMATVAVERALASWKSGTKQDPKPFRIEDWHANTENWVKSISHLDEDQWRNIWEKAEVFCSKRSGPPAEDPASDADAKPVDPRAMHF